MDPMRLATRSPSAFNHMVDRRPKQRSLARIRLDATAGSDDGTSEGQWSKQLNWVLTAAEDETEDQASLRRISPHATWG